jgi:hypothetical protein
MKVSLVRMTQEMSLAGDGDITNFVVFELPNGELVRAVVTEEGAAAIVSARMGGTIDLKPAQAPVARMGDILSFPNAHGEQVEGPVVFGGEEPTPEPSPPAPVLQRPRARAVAADENGYPVLRVQGGVDPSELSSNVGTDEDGFSQL